jgi:hypothetical protein
MNIFGYEVRSPFRRLLSIPGGRKVYPSTTSSTGVQLRSTDGQGPYTKYFANYIPRKVEASFYEFLREAIPVMDAAINRLVSLDGHIIVTGDNDALVEEIQEWFYNVPVNDIQKGIQSFHQNWTGEAFEQGFALAEFITDRKRTDIVGLRVADSKYIKFSRNAIEGTDSGQPGLTIYQKADNDIDYRPLDRRNLLYFSINNENQNPYGVPLFRSCEFVAKVLATMHNSILNTWERFGDPSFSVIYKTSRRDGADLAARRATIAEEFDTAVRSKREGKSADFIRAIDTASDLEVKIIGADGQVLDLEIPARHVLEQIIAKTGLPSWMLGMHWSTTQGLSDNEAEILLADVATRQAAKMPYFYNLIRTLLLLRGRTWKKGDWHLEWAQVNLKDVVKQAQARFLMAQADMMSGQAASGVPTAVPGGGQGKSAERSKRGHSSTSLEGGHPCEEQEATGVSPQPIPARGVSPLKACSGDKELTRPTLWPELDKIEAEYENRLKSDWAALRDKVLLLLKLSGPASGSQSYVPIPIPPRPSEADVPRPTSHGLFSSLSKDDPPTGLETFTYTDEQRAAIMKAMKNLIGTYDIDDPSSPVRWYYGQSYSAGLIQAVKVIGADRPILDIIKNSEIYDNLCANGFALLKDNVTKAITNRIIPEMEAQMLAGTNPRHVAATLKTIFEGGNSDWERLARTEMTMAAERAKLDEWAERKIERVEFVPAPDGCDLCESLADEYDISDCPIPGNDTHPRCRCSTRPATSEA